MKLSLVITLVCVMLLSTAKIGRPGDEIKHAKTTTETENKYRPSDKGTPSSKQPNPQPSTQVNEPKTYNYYGNFSYVPPKTPTKENFWVRNSAAISGISSIFVALFTLALVVTSYLQWTISRETLTGIERPLVLLKNVMSQNNLKTLALTFENIGRTPAFIKKMAFTHIALSGDLPKTPEYPDAPEFPPWGILVNGRPPSAFSINWDEQHRIPDDQVEQVRDGILKYYVFGYISYSDGAGNEHRSGFAIVFRPAAFSLFPLQGGFDVVNSAAYNYAT